MVKGGCLFVFNIFFLVALSMLYGNSRLDRIHEFDRAAIKNSCSASAVKYSICSGLGPNKSEWCQPRTDDQESQSIMSVNCGRDSGSIILGCCCPGGSVRLACFCAFSFVRSQSIDG